MQLHITSFISYEVDVDEHEKRDKKLVLIRSHATEYFKVGLMYSYFACNNKILWFLNETKCINRVLRMKIGRYCKLCKLFEIKFIPGMLSDIFCGYH